MDFMDFTDEREESFCERGERSPSRWAGFIALSMPSRRLLSSLREALMRSSWAFSVSGFAATQHMILKSPASENSMDPWSSFLSLVRQNSPRKLLPGASCSFFFASAAALP